MKNTNKKPKQFKTVLEMTRHLIKDDEFNESLEKAIKNKRISNNKRPKFRFKKSELDPKMMQTISFDKYLADSHRKNPKEKEEYDRLAPLFETIEELIGLRNKKHITQRQLAALAKITPESLCRFEKGRMANFSIDYLQKIIKPLGFRPKISFVKCN
jgi:DNA-binding XRE family transcriptional regulator